MYNIKWKERKRKMKTWNKGKRTLALLVCVLLTVLSVVPAMGATGAKGETSKFTINNTVMGHTYKLYQILVGDVSNLSNGTGTLSNVEPGISANKTDGESDEAFVERVYKEVKADNVTADTLGKVALKFVDTSRPAKSVVGDGSTQETDVNNGYYIVVDEYTKTGTGTITDGTDTISSYLVAVVGNTAVEPKDDYPTIDKKIVDGDANKAMDVSQKTDTAAIGDTINYEVSGNLPDMTGYTYYYYYITDTLSKGLTLVESSFIVMVGEKTLAINKDYHIHVTKNEDEATRFILAMDDLKAYVNENSKTIGSDPKIKITYNATVNEKAAIGVNPNTNTVHLNYSNNPQNSTRSDLGDTPGTPKDDKVTGQGTDKVTKTYVMELVILKVDETGKKLSGAQFTLVGENLTKVIVDTKSSFENAGTGETGEYYKLKNDTYTKIAPTDETISNYEDVTTVNDSPKYVRKTTTSVSKDATVEDSSKSISAMVNDEGYLVFTGLNAGEYTLKETKTPEGYNTMKDMTFTIEASQNGANTNEGGSINWNISGTNTGSFILGTNNIFTKITNLKGNVLPSTGGIGTRIFYIVGGILMVSAGIVLITKARFKKSK